VAWEYRVIRVGANVEGYRSVFPDPQGMEAELNKLGGEGWELVSALGGSETLVLAASGSLPAS
jgi:hypothetical protein